MRVNIRYNNVMLVQEIGQATAMILDSEKLLKLVIDSDGEYDWILIVV